MAKKLVLKLPDDVQIHLHRKRVVLLTPGLRHGDELYQSYAFASRWYQSRRLPLGFEDQLIERLPPILVNRVRELLVESYQHYFPSEVNDEPSRPA